MGVSMGHKYTECVCSQFDDKCSTSSDSTIEFQMLFLMPVLMPPKDYMR